MSTLKIITKLPLRQILTVLTILCLHYQLFAQDVEQYPLKVYPSVKVTILDDHELPSENYVVLGEVSARTTSYNSTRVLLEKFKQKAKAMGANAVMNIQVTEETHNTGVSLLNAIVEATSDDGYIAPDSYKTYKIMTGTAVCYTSSIYYLNNILKSEQYFVLDADSSITPGVTINYSVDHKNAQVLFGSKKAEKLYDQLIFPYSYFNLFEYENRTKEYYNQYDMLKQKNFFKLDGSLLYKKVKVSYNSDIYPSIKQVKIIHITESGLRTAERIKYLYKRPNYRNPIGRQFNSAKKKFLKENWAYDSKNRLIGKQYFKDGAKSPFIVCELNYFTEEEWDLFVKQYTVTP